MNKYFLYITCLLVLFLLAGCSSRSLTAMRDREASLEKEIEELSGEMFLLQMEAAHMKNTLEFYRTKVVLKEVE